MPAIGDRSHARSLRRTPPIQEAFFLTVPRVGIGEPGDRQRAQPRAAQEQRVLHHDARGSLGGGSEIMFQAYIARRVDSWVGGLQEVVDADSAFGVVPDASGLEIHAFDVGVRPMPARISSTETLNLSSSHMRSTILRRPSMRTATTVVLR